MNAQRISSEAAAKMATRHIRSTEPSTIIGVADAMHWCPNKAKSALSVAREMGLLTKVGKTDRGQYIFGAVQTADWPVPA